MSKNYELAERDYILGMKYQEIAEKYNVSIETVKSWKKRHNWERNKPVKKTAPNAPIAPLKNKKGCKGVQKHIEPAEELTDKEQIFCYHYIRTWNATQAALLAGYGGNKFSAKTIGYNLLQRPRVKQELDRLRSLFRQELHVDIQDFLEFCLKVVGADIGDYIAFGQKEVEVMGPFGPIFDKKTKKPIMQRVNSINLGDSDMLDTSVISEIKQGRDGISIKLADKKWAWEQLIKYFDWLPDKWQRKIEEDKLVIEGQKLEVLKQRNGNIDENAELVQFIDDIGGDDDAAD